MFKETCEISLEGHQKGSQPSPAAGRDAGQEQHRDRRRTAGAQTGCSVDRATHSSHPGLDQGRKTDRTEDSGAARRPVGGRTYSFFYKQPYNTPLTQNYSCCRRSLRI